MPRLTHGCAVNRWCHFFCAESAAEVVAHCESDGEQVPVTRHHPFEGPKLGPTLNREIQLHRATDYRQMLGRCSIDSPPSNVGDCSGILTQFTYEYADLLDETPMSVLI